MSSLLEQAIIDANLLKETAEKQAEKAVLEKYSAEIKGVYDTMLEATIDPLGDMAGEQSAQRDVGLDFEDDLDTGTDSLDAQVPYSFQDSEDILNAPMDDEEIEIDFDKLAAMLSDDPVEDPLAGLNGGGEDLMGLAGDEDSEDLGLGGVPSEEDDLGLDLEETLPSTETDPRFHSKAMGNAPEDRIPNVSPYVPDKAVKQQGKKTVTLKTSPLKEGECGVCETCGQSHSVEEGCGDGLDEKIIMDDEGNKSGWTSRPTDILSHELDKEISHNKFDKTPGEEFKDDDHKKDLEKKDTEYDDLKEEYNHLKQKFKEIYKENLDLQNKKDNYRLKVEELSVKNKNFVSLLERVQKELQRNQLNNFKLFYENKVFRDASLNERQKSKIVEVISEINTAEQVKPVYEALVKTKSTNSQKRESSNSLKETLRHRPKVARMAVSAKVSTEPKTQLDPAKERMQKLAGIKKKK